MSKYCVFRFRRSPLELPAFGAFLVVALFEVVGCGSAASGEGTGGNGGGDGGAMSGASGGGGAGGTVSSGGGDTGGSSGSGGTASSCTPLVSDGYTHDHVHLHVFRFEFPDASLEWSEEQIRADLDAVDAYYREQSYGRFRVDYTIHPTVFQSDRPKTDFDGDWSAFRNYYQESIASTGLDPEAPGETDRIMVTSPQIGNFNSSGGPPLMTVFHYSPGTVAHELGHVLGLRHSKAVEAGDSIFGVGDPATESQDYGNVYCMMGMGAHSLEEYNLLYKHHFGWVTCDEVPEVTETGTYRVFAFDRSPKIGGTPLGLRIRSGDGEYTYWVEYRTRGSYASGNGVLLNLEGYFQDESDPSYWKTTSYLLDMTPASQSTEGWWADDQTDSELVVGASYTDHWGGFTIRPVRTGGNVGDESAWIEIEVEIL